MLLHIRRMRAWARHCVFWKGSARFPPDETSLNCFLTLALIFNLQPYLALDKPIHTHFKTEELGKRRIAFVLAPRGSTLERKAACCCRSQARPIFLICPLWNVIFCGFLACVVWPGLHIQYTQVNVCFRFRGWPEWVFFVEIVFMFVAIWLRCWSRADESRGGRSLVEVHST